MSYQNKIQELNQRIGEETDNEIISLLNKMLITYKDLQSKPKMQRHAEQILRPLSGIES